MHFASVLIASVVAGSPRCAMLRAKCEQSSLQRFASVGDPLTSPMPLTEVLALIKRATPPGASPSDPAVLNDILANSNPDRKLFLAYMTFKDAGRYDLCKASADSHWCSVVIFSGPQLGECLPAACVAHEYLESRVCALNETLGTAYADLWKLEHIPALAPYVPLLANLSAAIGALGGGLGFLAKPSKQMYCEEEAPSLATADTGAVVVIVLTTLLLALTALATCHTLVGAAPPKGAALRLLSAFCAATNTAKLLRTRAPGADGADLAHLHGMRVLSTFSVVLGHSFLLFSKASANEAPSEINFESSFDFLLVLGIELSVDTFFWMSGFMAAFVMLLRMPAPPPGTTAVRSGSIALGRWCTASVHRFLRLTPVYAFVFFFYVYVFPVMGSGPFWAELNAPDAAHYCRTKWWTNLLYVNNIIGDGEGGFIGSNSCMGWSWYLANDMQFFLVTAALMTCYHSRPKLVSGCFVAAVAGCVAANAVLAAQVAAV